MMKSKAEMADALQICMLLAPDCKGCAYLPVADESRKCIKEMIDDIVDTLIKSDFEVISEIMSRSKNACMDNHSDIQGDLVIKAHLDLCFNFDAGGNIL